MTGRSREFRHARFGRGRDLKTSDIPFILNGSTDQLKKKRVPSSSCLADESFSSPSSRCWAPAPCRIRCWLKNASGRRPWKQFACAQCDAAVFHREGSYLFEVYRFCSSNPRTTGTSIPLPVGHKDHTPGLFNYLFFLSAFCLFSPSSPFFFVFFSLFSDSF